MKEGEWTTPCGPSSQVSLRKEDGSSHDLDVSGFHNHGDRCCPLSVGLWDPFQMVFPWLINGGDPNYLRYLGAHPPSTGDPLWGGPSNLIGKMYGSIFGDFP